MQLRTPERFVDVDVPEACDRALIEERGLERGAPPGKSLAELLCREGSFERLAAEPAREVVVDLVPLEQMPRPEAPDVAIRNIRSVV
jgi:hypothetical protein